MQNKPDVYKMYTQNIVDQGGIEKLIRRDD